ncbi:AbrB/MazE/SpoVT family DNA-binding domain-containing protein [Tianweitania sp.]|uniref:AbrB/MazE/SpoVT family DNA-binding domain-containing protein n=1 Tax=Tianweitania sp. TaxID=2021634 RepID=UPI00289DDDCE|nr:AbrB/MazE/SpoVT family DNA-binding domain-containing protein [Tianweitania sp.]
MSEIVREDGLVRLPEAVREQLGITPGMAVDFETDAGGKVVVVKSDEAPAADSLAKWIGYLRDGPTTDEIMEMSRGEV